MIKDSRSFTLTHHNLQYNIGVLHEYCLEQNSIFARACEGQYSSTFMQ